LKTSAFLKTIRTAPHTRMTSPCVIVHKQAVVNIVRIFRYKLWIRLMTMTEIHKTALYLYGIYTFQQYNFTHCSVSVGY